jgi:hypothetical protein
MSFERRDFLRLGAAGFAGSLLVAESAFSQGKDDEDRKSSATAELRSGSGSLSVDLRLRSGTLELQYEEFSHGKDRALIAHGSFAPHSGSKIKIYRSYFSANGAQQVFARLGDGDHWTSLMLARTEDANVESLTVWNDDKAPGSFRIDKNKFLAGANVPGGPKPEEYILDNRGGSLDLKGSRTPPDVTAEDLEDALDNNRDYLAFRRGSRPPHQHATMVDFVCGYLVIAVPGGKFFIIAWEN